MNRLIVALTLLAVSFVSSGNAERPLRIRIKYGKPVILKQKDSPELLMLQGMGDPLLFSSRASLTVWKFESLTKLRALWSQQHKSGIRKPKNVDVAKSTTIDLLANDVAGTFRFTVFETTFSWMPGDISTGWILLTREQDFEIASLSNYHYYSADEPIQFVDLEAHNLEVERDQKDFFSDEVQSDQRGTEVLSRPTNANEAND